MKWIRLILIVVGLYYTLRFVMRVYNARKKMNSPQSPAKNNNDIHPANKKSVINPNAGEYTDYEELKD
jgi:hypothetical protein